MNDYELALQNIKDALDILHKHIHDGTFIHPYWSISKIQELIDKDKWYEWHDLRENPEDLPNDYREKLVTVQHNSKYSNWNSYDLAYYSKSHHKWLSVLYGSNCEVIAWKEFGAYEVTE